MSNARSLPLNDSTEAFEPALIAVIVYLALISLTALLSVGKVADRWQDELASRLNVQLASDRGGEDEDARIARALATMRAQPEVAHADRLSEGRIAALLQPWIRSADLVRTLPLPVVIEVELRADARESVSDLIERLREDLPGAEITGGPALLAPALRLMRSIEVLAAIVVAALAGTLAAAVVYVTRARLLMRRETMQVLHLLGADENRVVDAVTRRALRTAAIGAGIGFLAGAATLIAFSVLHADETDLLADLSLPVSAWFGVATLPLIAALIAAFTARFAARRVLCKMP